MEFSIIEYEPSYGEQTVKMWRESKEQAIGQKDIHSFEDHLYFLNHILKQDNKVLLAIDPTRDQVAGILACNENWVNQLYIHLDYQGLGLGTRLLNLAKQQSAGTLYLYTFEVNKKAQRFYERNGFRIIGRGSINEEQLDDIKYEWNKS
ncbi:acetyltransferase (GNAT) family protein [Paenibacillus taihuensis]|uniref:Acetyltransferase (GNAT) family protein n=1 Tax=Paenibacillus taihuensis TaxID=1156355 RepID=A0A3D9S704_9BACL|nr:GNAT family N-acetyltransferase [Paenibacillus taihuensis]REE88937.1 acetyltransferase (GNAT) family protein [Paenibacillus taihuensis]